MMQIYDVLRISLLAAVLFASMYSYYLGISVYRRRKDETGWIFLFLSAMVGSYLLMYFFFSMVVVARMPDSGRIHLSPTDILPVIDELMYIPLYFIPALFLDFVLMYFMPGYRSYRHRNLITIIYRAPAYILSVLIVAELMRGNTLVRTDYYISPTGYYSGKTLFYYITSAYNYTLYLFSATIIGISVAHYRDRGKGVAGFYVLVSLVIGILLDAIETWFGYSFPIEITVFSFFSTLIGVSLAIKRERFLLLHGLENEIRGGQHADIRGVIHIDDDHISEFINTFPSSGAPSLFILADEGEDWPIEGVLNIVRIGGSSNDSLDLRFWTQREMLKSVIEKFLGAGGRCVVVDLHIFDNMPVKVADTLIQWLADVVRGGGALFVMGEPTSSMARKALDRLMSLDALTGTP